MERHILQIKNLTKLYGSYKALDNISLDIERGKVYGLLGPNGAGKTTLLRIINNLLTYDSGTVLVNGEKASYATAGYLGYLPEERGLYENMRVDEQIMFFGQLRGADKRKLWKTMAEYLEIFNLTADSHRKIKELSKGNQQKVQILATLVHEPELVMLDEPFSGFDPINGILLSNLIDRLKERGATIILSSHNMPAVEEICTDITLINKGRVLLSGSLADIKQKNKEGKYLFCLSKPYARSGNGNEVIGEIAVTDNPPGRNGSSYLITPAENATPRQLLNHISSNNEILLFEEKLPSLNEIFIKYAK